MRKRVGAWGLLTVLTMVLVMALIMTLNECETDAGNEDGLTVSSRLSIG